MIRNGFVTCRQDPTGTQHQPDAHLAWTLRVGFLPRKHVKHNNYYLTNK